MHHRRPIVIALGGNAISAPGERGDIDQQFAHMSDTAEYLARAVEKGLHIVLTHGNGPQVGNVLRRAEIASQELYPLPLEVCVADTQAGMGYMIGQCMTNALQKRSIERDITTLVTTVLVDRDDPAFSDPTKPIGPVMTREQAVTHQTIDGWVITPVADGLYRRIVPSPMPRRIMEIRTIQRLVEDGQLVICCGGGGVPVVQDADDDSFPGCFRGAAAVIDKDRTSALLAKQLNAKQLIILTAVDRVCLNYGKTNQQPLDRITIDEAKRYLEQRHFAEGSMQPKMEAAIDFVETSPDHAPGNVAVIGKLSELDGVLAGQNGTRITRN